MSTTVARCGEREREREIHPSVPGGAVVVEKQPATVVGDSRK